MFPSGFLGSSKIQEMPEQNHRNLRPSSSIPFSYRGVKRGQAREAIAQIACPFNKFASEQEQLCFEETCWNTYYM